MSNNLKKQSIKAIITVVNPGPKFNYFLGQDKP